MGDGVSFGICSRHTNDYNESDEVWDFFQNGAWCTDALEEARRVVAQDCQVCTPHAQLAYHESPRSETRSVI